MSRPRSLRFSSLFAALLVLSTSGLAGRAEPPESPGAAVEPKPSAELPADTPKSAIREAEERIRQALAKPISVDFVETPLETVAAFVQDQCGIPVLLDFRALEDAGIEPDDPVSLQVSEISLRAVLGLLLRQLDLTYIVRHEVLLVTTPEEAEDVETPRVYPVGEIVGVPIGLGEVDYDFDSLVELITSIVRPSSWSGSGPSPLGEADFANVKALVFAQSYDVHEDVAVLLAALRHVAKETVEGKIPEPILFQESWPEPAAYQAIRDALDRKISLDFQETPLKDVVAHLREAARVNFVLNRKALGYLDFPEDIPVSIRVADVPLRSALRLMLRDLDLNYQIWYEVILITTPEEAEFGLTTGIYPVGDLVASRDEAGRVTCDYDSLIDVITGNVERGTWTDVRGPGSVATAPFENVNALLISQTRDVHEAVADFLAVLRNLARQADEGNLVDRVMLDEETGEYTSARKAINEALEKRVEFDFSETSLFDVLGHVKNTFGINVKPDRQALDDVGIPDDTPVTIRVSGITLRSALALILEPLDLAWLIDDGVLLISTPEEEERRRSVGIYSVGDLVVCRDENDKLWDDYDSLIRMIVPSVAVYSWNGMGGPGSIFGGTFGSAKLLVIRQTRKVHNEILELLKELRRLAAQAGENGEPPRRNRPPRNRPQPISNPGSRGMGGGMF